MRLKEFISTTLLTFLATTTMPALAQSEPPRDGVPAPGSPPAEQPPPPSSAPAPTEEHPKDAAPPPATDQPSPETAATPDTMTTPESANTDSATGDEADADAGKIKIGDELSPLVITAGLGYAYASVSHPDLKSHSLSGAFLEVTAGTELDRRFRLSLAFTSFETKLRRTSNGKWEEGEYAPPQAALGLRSMAGPVDGGSPNAGGGVEVQKSFHANSVGPRVDFLPLGSQGPYLGMTAAVGIIQDVATRVGADLAARVGAEWRPFHSLGLAIEAGAHGQIYDDSKAAIPYALARLSLMLEPAALKRRRATSTPSNMVMPRTLPPPTQR